MKISQREIILGVLTLTAVLSGFTWYIVDSKMEEWHGMANEIEKTEQQISKHQTAIKMQENWLDELNGLQSELPAFDIKKRSVSPDLMKTIKQMSNKHGVDILKNSPYPEKQIGDLFELGINCTWDGTLESMVLFLGELQQQGVRYDVRTLSVAPVGKNSGKLKGNMVIHCAFTRKASAPEKKK
jgi:hypothetical protein